MSSKAEEMTNQLLEAIKETNPPLYDALVAIGRSRLVADASVATNAEAKAETTPEFGIKESLDGESVDTFLDRIVGEFQEKHGGVNVVVLDEDGNIVRDTRPQDATQAEEDATISCDVYNWLQYQGTVTMPHISYAAVEDVLERFSSNQETDYYTLEMTNLIDDEVSSATVIRSLREDGSYALEIEFSDDNVDEDYEDCEEAYDTLDPVAIISSNTDSSSIHATFYTERALEIFMENQ